MTSYSYVRGYSSKHDQVIGVNNCISKPYIYYGLFLLMTSCVCGYDKQSYGVSYYYI